MDSPPVVGKYVKNAQHQHQECSRPLGLEANGNHGASGKTEKGDKDTHEAPFALKNEAKEEEN